MSLLESLIAVSIFGLLVAQGIQTLATIEAAGRTVSAVADSVNGGWILQGAIAADVRGSLGYRYAGADLSIWEENGTVTEYRWERLSGNIVRSAGGYGNVVVSPSVAGVRYGARPYDGLTVDVGFLNGENPYELPLWVAFTAGKIAS